MVINPTVQKCTHAYCAVWLQALSLESNHVTLSQSYQVVKIHFPCAIYLIFEEIWYLISLEDKFANAYDCYYNDDMKDDDEDDVDDVDDDNDYDDDYDDEEMVVMVMTVMIIIIFMINL